MGAWGWLGCDDCCPDYDCTDHCENNDAPAAFLVVLAGIVNTPGPYGPHCTNCDDLNDTFTAEFESTCVYRYRSYPFCTPASIYCDGPANFFILMQLTASGIPATPHRIVAGLNWITPLFPNCGNILTFYEDYEDPIDCLNLSSEQLTNVHRNPGSYPPCDDDGSPTCHVTSL
jgi:hypothetical protein